MESKFDDFNRLFAYLNLEPTYKNRAWVIIDYGDEEKEIIDKLKATYSPNGWSEDHFQQFSQHDFENFYPEPFKEEVGKTLLIADKKQKRDRKISLLQEVESWISTDPKKAETAFKASANEVIQKLAAISKEIGTHPKE